MDYETPINNAVPGSSHTPTYGSYDKNDIQSQLAPVIKRKKTYKEQAGTMRKKIKQSHRLSGENFNELMNTILFNKKSDNNLSKSDISKTNMGKDKKDVINGEIHETKRSHFLNS